MGPGRSFSKSRANGGRFPEGIRGNGTEVAITVQEEEDAPIRKKRGVSGSQGQMAPNMFLTTLATIVALCSSVLSAQHSTPDFQSGKQSLKRFSDVARVAQLVPDQ